MIATLLMGFVCVSCEFRDDPLGTVVGSASMAQVLRGADGSHRSSGLHEGPVHAICSRNPSTLRSRRRRRLEGEGSVACGSTESIHPEARVTSRRGWRRRVPASARRAGRSVGETSGSPSTRSRSLPASSYSPRAIAERGERQPRHSDGMGLRRRRATSAPPRPPAPRSAGRA